MALIFYERVGHEGRRPSPFSWRIRYALAHKGLDFEVRPVRFADVGTIRALSGQHLTPVLSDGEHVVHETWDIACYLEDQFPAHRPRRKHARRRKLDGASADLTAVTPWPTSHMGHSRRRWHVRSRAFQTSHRAKDLSRAARYATPGIVEHQENANRYLKWGFWRSLRES